MTKAKLDLYADPLGDLYVEWSIPISFISDQRISFDLPTYKYEMSIFSGIPIPFSSLAESLDYKIYQIVLTDNNQTDKISYKIEKKFKGQHLLVIDDSQILTKKNCFLVVQFVIKKLVTKDKVFFNFVYTISSPIQKQIVTDINIIVHFSYHISSYRFKTVLIDQETGRIKYDAKLIKHWRIGDYIYGKSEDLTIFDNGGLDLHVHGSRLPFKIDRRIFWILLFIFAFLGVGGIISLIRLLL